MSSDTESTAADRQRPTLPLGMEQLIVEAGHELDQALEVKAGVGAREYGEFEFLKRPTLEMAMDEIVDLINYARFTYIKLYLLNFTIKKINDTRPPTKEGFISTSQLFGGQQH